MRKGQTAMEYLMTYGWAILIILIVAGVLAYYGVFSPSGFLGPSARGFAEVYILQPWSFNAAGTLTFKIENRVGADITLTNAYGKIGTTSQTVALSSTITAGEQSGFLTSAFTSLNGTSGNSYSLDLWLEYYTTNSSVRFNSTGTLSGTRA